MGKVTLRIVQKYETKADGKRNVRLRITVDRVTRFISTPIDVASSAFNPKGKRESANWIKTNHPNQGIYNETLRKLWDRAVAVVDQLGQEATVDAVKQNIQTEELVQQEPEVMPPSLLGFRAYIRQYIARRGDSATTDTYRSADNAFGRFLAASPGAPFDIDFADLTVAFLKQWRQWVLDNYKNNSAWLYHSRLKSLYFQAIEDVEGLTSIPSVVSDPFRRVKIPKKKTRKMRLYEDEISRLAALELPWGSPMRRARDISLMMYYAHGMRVGDALRLRLDNYVIVQTSESIEHRLIYTMGKTNKPKNVLLPRQAITLLEPYRAACLSPRDTLFSYLRRVIDMGYDEYRLRLKIKPKIVLIRDNLHKLAELAGIEKAISAHVFRHSFADLARRGKMDVVQIQKALGHDQISTTQGYLEELDQSSVDEVRNLFK